VGLLAFGDRFFGEEPQILKFAGSHFTSDPAAFVRELHRVRMFHGGDDPESSLDALAEACQLSFRSNATKAIILVTDAEPKSPDRSGRNQAATAAELERYRIDQLHLVVQEMDLPAYHPLQAKCGGEVFLISEVASQRQGFDKVLRTVGQRVAERTTRSLLTQSNFAPEQGRKVLALTALWTAAIGLGVYLSLVVAQGAYLRRSVVWVGFSGVGVLTVLAAAVISGLAGQVALQEASSSPLGELCSRGAGWALLGVLLGFGLARVVPNIAVKRACLGGMVGGLLAAVSIHFITQSGTELAARLAGAAALGGSIGMMLALVEQLAREASVVVHWAPNETSILSLGAQPVLLGSAAHAQIYLPGYPPVAGVLLFESGQVKFENKTNGQAHLLRNGSQIQLGRVAIEISTS
jgi:Ca-activated chloride channel homolog